MPLGSIFDSLASRREYDDNGKTLLYWAIVCRQPISEYLSLKAGALGVALSRSGAARDETEVFLFAAQTGHLLLIEHFIGQIDCVAYLLRRDEFNRTALAHAAAAGHTEIVRCLVAAILRARQNDLINAAAVFPVGHSEHHHSGFTPLHWVAERGDDKGATILCREAKADVRAVAHGGRMPIHVAAAKGHMAVAKCLVEYDVDLLLEEDTNKQIPLTLAISHGHVEMARYFYLAAAAPGALLRATATDTDDPGYRQFSLHWAAYYGHEELAAIWLNRTDIHAVVGDKRFQAIHVAASRGQLVVARRLIAHDTDLLNAEMADGITPLMAACVAGHVSMVRYLASGPRINLSARYKLKPDVINLFRNNSTFNQFTALHFAAAAKAQSDEMVAALLELKADAHAVAGDSGMLPIHVAAEYEHMDAVKHFIKQDVRLASARNALGVTLLMMVCKRSKPLVDQLLSMPSVMADFNVSDNYGRTASHYAVEWGNIDITSALLEAKATDGFSLLMIACESGSLSVIQFLLSIVPKIDLSARNAVDDTVLHRAAATKRNAIVVHTLLEAKADAKAVAGNGRMLPVHVAAETGDWGMVKLFIDHDASLAVARNGNGSTPLMIACGRGHLELVKQLLLLPPDSIGLNVGRHDGSTALHLAAAGGYANVVSALLEAKANVRATAGVGRMLPIHSAASAVEKKESVEVVRRFIKHDPSLATAADANGLNPLMIACQVGHSSMVHFFLLMWPTINLGARDKANNTALYWAGIGGDLSVAFAVLSCSPFSLLGIPLPPIHLAARAGVWEVVKLFIDCDASAAAVAMNCTGSTPLMIACEQGHQNVAKKLLLLPPDSIDLNGSRNDGSTALHIAAARGDVDVVSALLEAKANARVGAGVRRALPIHNAAEAGSVAVVKHFIVYDPTLAIAANANGSTPLMIACARGHVPLVKYLLSVPGIKLDDVYNPRPCPEEYRHCSGFTLLHWAVAGGHAEIVSLLLVAGASMDAVAGFDSRLTPMDVIALSSAPPEAKAQVRLASYLADSSRSPLSTGSFFGIGGVPPEKTMAAARAMWKYVSCGEKIGRRHAFAMFHGGLHDITRELKLTPDLGCFQLKH